MIQRKQTLFLIGTFVMTLLCLCLNAAGLFQFLLLIPSSLLSVGTIFLFKRRRLQASLCMLNMLILLAWYILLAAMPQMFPVDMMHCLSVTFPLVAIIFLFLARKGIIADEKLVRSLDRIR